jgi:hypothetical protein
MGVSILTMDMSSGTYVQPGRIEDDTWNPLGGPIKTWPFRTGINDGRRESHPIWQSNGEVYCLNGGASSGTGDCYKLIRECLTITVDESTVGSPTQGAAISNSGGSGATGTFQQFHAATKTLYYTPGTGTFLSGETIDIVGGSSVTTNAAPQQSNGGGADTGEWVDLNTPISASTKFFAPATGISASGDSVIAIPSYSTSAVNIFDPGAESWTQSGAVTMLSESGGIVTVFNNIAYWVTNSSSTFYVVAYNFTTGVATSSSFSGYGVDIFTLDDRLFLVSIDTGSTTYVYELLVGVWTQLFFRSTAHASGQEGVLVIPNDNAAYVIVAGTTYADWVIDKLIVTSPGGALDWATAADDDALAKAILPAAYTDSGTYAPTTIGASKGKWIKFFEQETNGVTSDPRIMVFLKEAQASGNVHRFVWPDPTALANTYVWDGTTTVIASGTPGDLAIGDFLMLDGDTQRRSFEVTNVVTTTITITDPESVGIPDTSASSDACSKESSMTALSITTTLNDVFCPTQDTGGTEYLWKPERLTGRITRNYGLTSASRIFFKVTHPTGADVKVKLYYTADLSSNPGTLASISNVRVNDAAPGGTETVTANQALNLAGNGTDEFSVDWDFDGDGVSEGADVKLRIYVEEV